MTKVETKTFWTVTGLAETAGGVCPSAAFGRSGTDRPKRQNGVFSGLLIENGIGNHSVVLMGIEKEN